MYYTSCPCHNPRGEETEGREEAGERAVWGFRAKDRQKRRQVRGGKETGYRGSVCTDATVEVKPSLWLLWGLK